MTGRHHADMASEATDEIVVDVLVDGMWNRGVADWRQYHDDAWHLRVRVKEDSAADRHVWARYPDQVRFPRAF